MSDKIEPCGKCGKEPIKDGVDMLPVFRCCGSAWTGTALWNDRQRLIRAEARIKVLEEALSSFVLSDEYYSMLEVDKKPDDYDVYGYRAIDYRKARAALRGES